MAYIYKIINDVNNKIYIGKTEHANPETRWKEHLRACNILRFTKRPLYDAMNKYGKEHFHFEVIEETDIPEEREQYWIEKLRTYVGFDDCNGYNATLGGDGNACIKLNEDEVIKYHIEEANYNAKITSDYFNVSVKPIKRILKNNHIIWLTNNDNQIVNAYKECGGVIQVDIQTKLILNIFENANRANEYMHKSKTTEHIRNACRGMHNGSHYAYGYLWYYGKDLQRAIENGDIVEIDKIGEEYIKGIMDV